MAKSLNLDEGQIDDISEVAHEWCGLELNRRHVQDLLQRHPTYAAHVYRWGAHGTETKDMLVDILSIELVGTKAPHIRSYLDAQQIQAYREAARSKGYGLVEGAW